MEKVIYENKSSKLVAKAYGGVVELEQSLEGEVIATVSMFYKEVKELKNFIDSLGEEQ